MMNEQVRCGHDETVFRHFRGLNEEISREIRLLRARDLPVVELLTDLNVFLARMRYSTTVVYGVDEIRLFNGDNLETTRFRFPSPYVIYTQKNEERVVRENHNRRMQVINALTDGTSTVTTVLPECWEKEVSTFCRLNAASGKQHSLLK